MTPFASSTISGILGGVITSAVIYFWIKIFNKIILPWYKHLVYRGIDISGEWYCGLPNSHQKIYFKINQVANEISGAATHIAPFRKDLEYEPCREFLVSGIIQDRIISIISTHKNHQRLGIGSFLLEVTRDGRHLSGVFSYHNIQSNKITQSQVLFFRDPKAKELCEADGEPALPST